MVRPAEQLCVLHIHAHKHILHARQHMLPFIPGDRPIALPLLQPLEPEGVPGTIVAVEVALEWLDDDWAHESRDAGAGEY